MRAYRSPLRLFLFGLIGLLMMMAAVDVMWGHWISTEPDHNEGVLSTRGLAQQRGDILWGAAMIGVGTFLLGGAVVELVRRKPQCVVTSNGIKVPVGVREKELFILWTNVRDVWFVVEDDPYDGSHRKKLVIDVVDPVDLPVQPYGGEWRGSQLHLDAQDWTRDADEVATAARAALEHYRRVAEIKLMEQPSLTWETTVTSPGDGGLAVLADPDAAEITEGDEVVDSGALPDSPPSNDDVEPSEVSRDEDPIDEPAPINELGDDDPIVASDDEEPTEHATEDDE